MVEPQIDECPCYTLSEATEEYLLTRGVDKKKYYTRYLVIAQRVWQKIFWNTLWVSKSVWQTLKKGDPYDYIDVPKGAMRIFTINVNDDCGKIVPLWYNNQLDVVKKPLVRKCGCEKCDCAGLCEDVNGFTVTTKVLFTINGIDYSEKTWLKYCPNGDIWEYSQIPTKKYLDFTGDAGDYNNDYNNDYYIGEPPLANFEIVTQTVQRKICALTIKPCGCPEETPENQQLLLTNCGCFLPFSNTLRRCHCDPFLANPNPDCLGEVKISECGTRIYYRPTWDRHRQACMAGSVNPTGGPRLPQFLNIIYQTDGKTVDSQTVVPEFSIWAMFAGIDHFSKQFNNKYSLAEKKSSEYYFEDQCNKIIVFLNPLNLETQSHVQDAIIRW